MSNGMAITEELKHVRFAGVAEANSCHQRPSHRISRSFSHNWDRPIAPPPDENADAFISTLLRRAGLSADAYRPGPLRRRVPACLRALRASSVQHAQTLLDQRPALLPRALSAILLGVTGFFRDAPAFECLASTVLPHLARDRSALRVWSAACSEGQELYSIAILLAEMNLLRNSHLLGSDCRADAIERARAGYFHPAEMLSVEPRLTQRYFTREDSRFRAIPALRNRLQWKVADLLAGAEAGAWDLILWRNSAIYLQPEAANQIWSTLSAAHRPGGVLVVGKAESPPASQPFSRVAGCIYRKLGVSSHD